MKPLGKYLKRVARMSTYFFCVKFVQTCIKAAFTFSFSLPPMFRFFCGKGRQLCMHNIPIRALQDVMVD